MVALRGRAPPRWKAVHAPCSCFVSCGLPPRSCVSSLFIVGTSDLTSLPRQSFQTSSHGRRNRCCSGPKLEVTLACDCDTLRRRSAGADEQDIRSRSHAGAVSRLPAAMALGFPELIFCAGLLLVLYNHVSSWRQNIAKARKTGFPYIAVRRWHLALMTSCVTPADACGCSIFSHLPAMAAHTQDMGAPDPAAAQVALGALALVSPASPPPTRKLNN